MEQVAKGNLEQEERITARVKGLVMQYDKGIQKQFKEHADILEMLKETHEKNRRDMVDLQGKAKVVEKTLALAEAIVSDPSNILRDEDWERPPDRTILRIACAGLVSKESVLAEISQLLRVASAPATTSDQAAHAVSSLIQAVSTDQLQLQAPALSFTHILCSSLPSF